MLKKVLFSVLGILMCFGVAAQASLIDVAVSQYGDVDMLDGFVQPDGSFNWNNLRGLPGEGVNGAPGITDTWLRPGSEDISWQQTGFAGVLEEITSAYVFMGHGGFGLDGIVPVFSLFGEEVRAISSSSGINGNQYLIDVFNITGFAERLLGENLNFSLGSIAFGDNGAIDFSTVVAFGVPASAAPVPEPATMLLFGTGFAGLVGVQLWKKRKEKKTDEV